jgi:hypothetical protein
LSNGEPILVARERRRRPARLLQRLPPSCGRGRAGLRPAPRGSSGVRTTVDLRAGRHAQGNAGFCRRV